MDFQSFTLEFGLEFLEPGTSGQYPGAGNSSRTAPESALLPTKSTSNFFKTIVRHEILMYTSPLPALCGLLLCIGCTSESVSGPSPKVEPSLSTPDATKAKPKAAAQVQATTATWVVYEMPG